jgi:hypothetical protein
MTSTDIGAMSIQSEPAESITGGSSPNTFFHFPRLIRTSVLVILVSTLCSCGVVNLGKYKGIEKADADEEYYLLKDVKLTGGLSAAQREHFDHTLLRSVNVVFVPNNEKNHYISKTVWYDPSGTEYRMIRKTHDKQQEVAQGEERKDGGTPRVHSIKSKELFEREPGRWKVELFLDDRLARRLEFTVR